MAVGGRGWIEVQGRGGEGEGGGGRVRWETTKKHRWPTNVTTKSFKHNNNFLNTT